MQNALIATVIAPLRSDPTLKNELEWFLGHWRPLRGAEVTSGILIKQTAVITNPGFYWFLLYAKTLYQEQRLFGNE
jgi:hypothetical protein